MNAQAFLAVLATAALVFVSAPATAQMRPGLGAQVDALAVFQGSATLSGGGAFKANRQFLRGNGLYNLGEVGFVGLSASLGRFEYDFSDFDNQPWSDIRDTRISVPVRLNVGETATVFFAPGIRWDYERGVNSSEGRTYGVFAGVSWKFSESLTIGPAFGAYSQLDDSSTDVFPALLVNWDITERWNLSTGSAVGATSGPGLTLGYKIDDAMTVSLAARSERVRFRLGDRAIAPGGVGEDSSLPVVVAFEYAPNPGVSVTAFAGAEFDGELALGDASGTEVSKQSYDTAPLFGFAARLRF